jgi:hypothetical protein
MTTKIEIELPDATAKAATEAGLLTTEALDRLLTEALRRRRAADWLLTIADRVAEAGIEPMSTEEIDAEVKAVHAERRRDDAGGMRESADNSKRGVTRRSDRDNGPQHSW